MTPRVAVRRPRALAALLAAALATFASPPPAIAAGTEQAAKVLIERVAPAVVSIRVVVAMKISVQGRSADIPEQNETVQGTVVDPAGLVMVGSEEPMIRALESTMTGLSVAVSMRGFHVQLPGEATERDAVVVARDNTIGLGFLQILAADGTAPSGLAAVDLSAGGDAAVGDEVYGVRRMSKGFDYAPEVQRAFVCGRYEQPRLLSVLSGNFTQHGLPVYDGQGKPAGVYVVQVGTEPATSIASLRDSMSGGLLPLSVVRASVERVKKLVPDALKKAKSGEKGGEKPGDEKKPGGEKEPDAKPPEPEKPGPKGARAPR